MFRTTDRRQDDKAIMYRMLSASASGGEERVMAERKPPYPTVATCAPSGRFAVVQDDSGNLELLDFATGKKRPFVSGTTWKVGFSMQDGRLTERASLDFVRS